MQQRQQPATERAEIVEALPFPPPNMLLPLNVGFASVELDDLQHWPWHELRMRAHDHAPTDEGIAALLEHMDFVLDLPQTCTGFMLTYHVEEEVTLPLDVVMRIICWCSEPSRQEKWRHRCLCWKMIIENSWAFGQARVLFSLAFSWSPPPCEIYLVTRSNAALEGDDAVCYKPDQVALEGVTRLWDSLVGEEEYQKEQGEAKAVVHAEKPAEKPASREPLALRASLDLGCVELQQGFDEQCGMGYVRILGRDAEVTDKELDQMTEFLDLFVDSQNAAAGFSITYDLRSLRTPSMSLVLKVAEWGAEPGRQEKWTKLNLACKVVVSGGMRYSIAKGVLSTFFFLCPPVCRTYLLSDLDDPDATSTVFEPTATAAVTPATDQPAAQDSSADQDSCSDGHRGQHDVQRRPAAPDEQEDPNWTLLTTYIF